MSNEEEAGASSCIVADDRQTPLRKSVSREPDDDSLSCKHHQRDFIFLPSSIHRRCRLFDFIFSFVFLAAKQEKENRLFISCMHITLNGPNGAMKHNIMDCLSN